MGRCPNCGFIMHGNICQNCSLSEYDNDAYLKFAGPALIDKTINTLEGIILGINLDTELNQEETLLLRQWKNQHEQFLARMPFNEIMITLENVLSDNKISKDEQDDLLWVCKNVRPNSLYYDSITTDLQILQGILHGIIIDKDITRDELLGLEKWLECNNHLAKNYPYDEIYELVKSVLFDGIISQNEVTILKNFFARFCEVSPASVLTEQELLSIKQATSLYAVCVVEPKIQFKNNLFCFTGKSSKGSRRDIAEVIINAGGLYKDNIISSTKYLIVGDDGNPCWAFACYGRKIEKAIIAKKAGQVINIIHETDFWKKL